MLKGLVDEMRKKRDEAARVKELQEELQRMQERITTVNDITRVIRPLLGDELTDYLSSRMVYENSEWVSVEIIYDEGENIVDDENNIELKCSFGRRYALVSASVYITPYRTVSSEPHNILYPLGDRFREEFLLAIDACVEEVVEEYESRMNQYQEEDEE